MDEKEQRQLLLEQPEKIRASQELAQKVIDQLNHILLGRNELHRMVFIGILSRGHILLEGVPGVGKTSLIKALGQVLQLDFKRVQFTPDLMPGDILGTNILQQTAEGRKEMLFQSGPVFTNILLADEINRASPKTQSALLEAMQECSVTLLGTTRSLPRPFFVLASQNPIELEGTYPLPEAQLDRFLFKLQVSQADVDTLEKIIMNRRRGEPPQPTWIMQAQELENLFKLMENIELSSFVAHYISRLVTATHPTSAETTENVRKYVAYGASPRAAIAIAEAARAHALLAGKVTVDVKDVNTVAPAALNHRVILNYKAKFDQIDVFSLLENLRQHIEDAVFSVGNDIRLKKTAQ